MYLDNNVCQTSQVAILYIADISWVQKYKYDYIFENGFAFDF